jgi:hypothetical protein
VSPAVHTGPEGRRMVPVPHDTRPTPATEKAMAEFDAAFIKAMSAERAELAAAPKVHDPKKREYVEEVDPALADK